MSDEQNKNLPSVYGAYKIEDDFKDMRPQDNILPRLVLMQGQSKQVSDGKAAFGDWFDTSAQTTVIKRGESKLIIPVMLWLEWIEWNPSRSDAGKRILGRSVDPNSDLAKIAAQRVKVKNPEGKEVNRVNETYTFLVLVPEYFGDYQSAMLISFAKSAYFSGKQFYNRIKMLKRKMPDGSLVSVPMPAAAWPLRSFKKDDPKGVHMIPEFGECTFLDDATCAETLATAGKYREARDAIKGASVNSAETVDDAHDGAPAVDADKAPF